MTTNTTPDPTTLALEAAASWSFRFSMVVSSLQEAQDLKARFPKVCRLVATTLSTWDGETGETVVFGLLTNTTRICSDGVNGGKNETGAARYRAILKAAGKLGITIEYRRPYANSFPSQEALEEFLGV